MLPLGTLSLERPEPFLQVEDGKQNELRLLAKRTPASTLLELEGVSDQYLPITVHPRRADAEVIVDDDQLVFIGNYRWRATTHHVPSLPFRCQLVVAGRGRTFLSENGLSISGGKVIVPVTPACRVRIRWVGKANVACSGAIVTVTSPAGAEVLVARMRRDLVRQEGDMIPALVASLVVPLGRVQLQCQAADGRVMWIREHDARDIPLNLTIRDE